MRSFPTPKRPQPARRAGSVAVPPAPAPARTSPRSAGASLPFQPASRPGGAFAVDAQRQRLVQSLRERGVRDPSVLQALLDIDRHLFIDDGLSGLAYQDEALPIGFGQTISKPSTVARMLELMGARMQPALRRKAKVLEVGTGCGYQAACMASLFGEVYSIERVKGLHELARQNLRTLRLANLRLVFGDGYQGVPSVAPFDAIIVAAAAPQVPPALLEQLRVGGRLVIPVGDDRQALQVIDRVGSDDYQMTALDAVRFVPLVDGTR